MIPSIIVMAKSPRPGLVKTRLYPSLDPVEAARLAEAALRDTLAAVASTIARPILALDGPIGDWLPDGFTVIPQRGSGLDVRIANALGDMPSPVLVIGSDTPQITPGLLAAGLAVLDERGADASLGPAADGGWWALGLRDADPRAVVGVPMSTAWTGFEQQRRLRAMGLSVFMLPVLRDVDTIDDARIVAAEAPRSIFATEFARLMHARAERVRAIGVAR